MRFLSSRQKTGPELTTGVEMAGARLPACTEQCGLADSKLLMPDGKLRSGLVELLDRYHIPTGQADQPRQILAAMQKNWWGDHGGLNRDTLHRYAGRPAAEHIDLLETLGYISDVTAPVAVYDYALVPGGPLDWVRSRLENLKREWLRGIDFKEIVLLGSDRPLNLAKDESPSRLLGHGTQTAVLPVRPDWQLPPDAPYADEMDMMHLVFEQAELPEEWGPDIPVRWVKSVKGSGIRYPNTEATVIDYLKETPIEYTGRILTASSQPFAHYQNLVTATVFAEARVHADDFVATGMAGDGTAAPVYYEAVYLDQLIRRFGYEVRLFDALRKREAAGMTVTSEGTMH